MAAKPKTITAGMRRIARQTLNMPDAIANWSGPNKAEAREILKRTRKAPVKKVKK